MTSNASPTRILGSLRSADGAGIVRIEDRYDTDIDDLWSAITDPVRLARWHGQIEGDLRPGGEFRLYLEADDIDSTGRIDICEPPRRLVVTTRETDESYRKGQGVPQDYVEAVKWLRPAARAIASKGVSKDQLGEIGLIPACFEAFVLNPDGRRGVLS